MVLYQSLVISELLCTELILMYGHMNFVTAIMVCLCASWIGPVLWYFCYYGLFYLNLLFCSLYKYHDFDLFVRFFLCPSFQYGSRFLVSSLLFVDVSWYFSYFFQILLIELSVGPISYLWFVTRANSLVWCILSPWYAGNNWFVGFFSSFIWYPMSITLETNTFIWSCFEVHRKQPNRHQAEKHLLIIPTNIKHVNKYQGMFLFLFYITKCGWWVLLTSNLIVIIVILSSVIRMINSVNMNEN